MSQSPSRDAKSRDGLPSGKAQSSWGAMAHLYEQVLSIVTKPPVERQEKEIHRIVYWFRKKSELFKDLKEEIVKDIVKNCQFSSCPVDEVIIRQGELGDCFYIILSGSVVIYIDTNLSEEDFEEIRRKQSSTDTALLDKTKSFIPLDRSKFGNYIGKITAGKSFGELALIRSDSVRNATIIADEPTDLLVVNRDLYNRSLHAYQKHEFETKKNFVDQYQLFRNWQPKYKKMMAMSLVKKNLRFEDIVIKQTQPVEGLYFIISGQMKIVIDPSQHPTQYPDLFPKTNVADLEKEKARDLLRKEMNLEPSKIVDKKVTFQRMKTPQHDGKKDSFRQMELCLLAPVEIIGDIEMVLGLSTYAQTIICTQEAEIYFLDLKNYDRLIEKRNPQAIDLMRNILHTKLTMHFKRLSEDKLPLFRFFLYVLDEKERTNRMRDAYQSSKPVETANTIENLQKGPLVNLFGPGSVFYMIRMREQEKKRRSMMSQQYRAPRTVVPQLSYGANKSATALKGKKNVEDMPRGIPTIDFSPAIGESPLGTKGSMPSKGLVLSQMALVRKSQDTFSPRIMFDGPGDGTGRDMQSLGTSHAILDRGDSKMKPTRMISFLDDLNVEDEAESGDEFDWTVGDEALSQLENRIQAWHNSFEGIESKTMEKIGNNTVKLHRYQLENENHRPKPGNKVFLRPRERAKSGSFTYRNDDDASPDTDRSAKTYSTRTPISSAGVYIDIVSNQQSDEEPETVTTKKHRSRQSKRSKSQQSRRFTFKVKKSGPRRQYTVEEYQALKEELRRRQRAYKSFLPMGTTTVL